MSLRARNALRAIRRPGCQVRSYTSTSARASYLAEREAVEHHAHGLYLTPLHAFPY